MASEVGSAFVSLIPSARGFSALVRRELRAQLANLAVSVPVQADLDEAQVAATARRASAVAQSQISPTELSVEVDRRKLQELGQRIGHTVAASAAAALKVSGAALLGSAVAVALVGVASAAGAAIPALAGFAVTLANSVKVLVAVPGAIAVLVTALNVLKVGLVGVEETFKAIVAGDAEAFNKALKKLAPSAQALARAVFAMRPAFKALQLGVQNVLFRQTAQVFRELAGDLLPIVSQRFEEIAAHINTGVVGALRALNSAVNREKLSGMFAAVSRTAGNLVKALRPVGQALLDVIGFGADLAAEFSGRISAGISRFAERISALADTGKLRVMFDQGVEAAKILFRLLGDIAGIVGGIASAAQVGAGAGLFVFFEKLNELVNSPAGFKNLQSFFAGLAVLGDALVPVFGAALGALAALANVVASISVAFAPALTGFFEALGPALVTVGAGFNALAPAVGVLTTLLGPLSTILADLLIGAGPGLVDILTGLASGLSALAPVAGVVGKAIGDMLGLIGPLLAELGPVLAIGLAVIAPAISNLAAVLTPILAVGAQVAAVFAEKLLPVLSKIFLDNGPLFVALGLSLAKALMPLIPIAATLAQVFAGQLAVHLPKITAIFIRMLPVIEQVTTLIGTHLASAFTALIPKLPGLISAGVGLALAFADLAIALLPLLPPLTQIISQVILLILNSGQLQAVLILTTVAVSSMAFAVGILAAVVRGTVAVFTGITTAAGKLAEGVASAVRSLGEKAASIRDKITGAVGDLGRLLYDAGAKVVSGLIDGITSKFGALANTASSMANTIRRYLPFSPAKTGPLSGSGAPFRSGQAIASDMAAGIANNLPKVEGAGARLAGAVAQSGAMRRTAGTATAAPSVEIDATGLPRALAEWLRYSVRAKGRGGTVDSAYGQGRQL